MAPGRGRQWIADLWQSIFDAALAGREGVPEFPWSRLPALGRFSISQPSLYKLADGWNTVRRAGKRVRKPFTEQVKPANFLLVAYIDTGTLIREAYREPRGHLSGAQPIRPVAPYEPNPKNWRKLPWQDLHTGQRVKLSWSKKRRYLASELPVQTFRDVIVRFLRHPEAKAEGGGSAGTLQPMHIVITSPHQVRHIGKEANQLDQVQVLGLRADTYLHYQDEGALRDWLRVALKGMPRGLVSEYAEISERQIGRFLSGMSSLRRKTMIRLLQTVRAWRGRWLKVTSIGSSESCKDIPLSMLVHSGNQPTGAKSMPTPRVAEEGPPEEIAIVDDMREDVAYQQYLAREYVAGRLDQLMPAIRQILAEAEALLAVNPSASVVWSVQGLEFLLKSGILRPCLRYRLSFDTELADQVFGSLVGRNGSNEAKKWLSRLFDVSMPEFLMKTGRGRLWSELWRDPPKEDTGRGHEGTSVTIVGWRNRIIHSAHVASEEEARQALRVVREFVDAVYSLFRKAGPQTT